MQIPQFFKKVILKQKYCIPIFLCISRDCNVVLSVNNKYSLIVGKRKTLLAGSIF